MNLLITGAACDLAGELAKSLSLSGEHRIRLTDRLKVKTDFEFVRSDLSHTSETNELVRGMDAIIHLAEFPLDSSERQGIDFLTRCTYNLLWAAVEEKVPRLIYSSTLQLLEKYAEALTVSENWCPLPSCEAYLLSKYLGEFICREFAHEGKIDVICLRLGNLVRADLTKGKSFDPTWVELRDVIHAFDCALKASVNHWSVVHIGSDSPGARFSIAKAKRALGYKPQYNFEE